MTKQHIVSREEFTATVNELAKNQVTLARLEAERDAQIQAVQERYSARAETLKAMTASLFDECCTFAEDHREAICDATSKGGRTELAEYGFRTGTPKISPLSRKFDEQRIVGLLKTCDLAWAVRVKEEVDKDGLLGAHAQGLINDDQLRAVGLRRTQSEKFWVTPLAESGETVRGAVK